MFPIDWKQRTIFGRDAGLEDHSFRFYSAVEYLNVVASTCHRSQVCALFILVSLNDKIDDAVLVASIK